MSDTDGVRSPQSLTDEAESAIRCVDDSRDDNDGADCNLHASIIEVQCGKLCGKLHMEKYICPGIHQNCIEVEGELLSPKDYTIRANKDKQKDWKGSIRIGKSNLRALMEMKQLDFYQHDLYCSGKCQSRNYIATNKADSIDFALVDASMKNSLESTSTSSSPMPSRIAISGVYSVASCTQSMNSPNFVRSRVIGVPVAMKTEPTSSYGSSFFMNNMAKSSTVATDGYCRSQTNMNVMKRKMISEPEQFWASMHQLGILDELVGDISHAVEKLKSLYASRPELRATVADQLSSLANILNLGEQIGDRVHSKRVQTAIESNVLNTELQELQRKAEERKRKQEDAKRKAAMLDRLFDTSSSAIPPAKSLRLT